jgi:hypothetical protein
MFLSEGAGFRVKFAPVHKSFDVDPLAILVQAGLRPARKKEEGAYPAM